MLFVSTFYRATLETRNYTFEAFGADGLQAMALLRRALEEHARQTGGDFAYLLECLDDVQPEEFQIGQSYRDGHLFRYRGGS